MKQHHLPQISRRKKKRLGRGYASGKGGHTSSRGSKGQKARGKVKIWFEGGQLALIRRLPKTRGKGRFKPLKPSPVIINLKDLSNFKKDSIITEELLAKKGIVFLKEAKKYGIKVLGTGDLKVPLTIKVPISKAAKVKIEKAGGKVE
jgi:large subunit ribosomal protein L15